MRKIILLSALFFALFSVLTPHETATAMTIKTIKKKLILQGSRYDPPNSVDVFISFRTGTNTVIGVECPAGVTALSYTYSSASATISTITVNNFMVQPVGFGGSIDVSGDYDVY